MFFSTHEIKANPNSQNKNIGGISLEIIHYRLYKYF